MYNPKIITFFFFFEKSVGLEIPSFKVIYSLSITEETQTFKFVLISQ